MVRAFAELAAEERALAGGKGSILARLYQAGYPVPQGFVILSTAFDGDSLPADAWAQAKTHLRRIRKNSDRMAFAVRSSALSEDSAQASFAGEFETVLDVRTDEAILKAIHQVRRSRSSTRVEAYSQAQGIDTPHEMAVVVQRLVPADLSGVLFTADPVTGDRTRMVGNLVSGLGERLVSGEVNPQPFAFRRPKGEYDGPPSLRHLARRLFRLAVRLEVELGDPQDIEWAIAGRHLFLLQSRPITTLRGQNPATGEWNDSLRGDFLWSNSNFAEAIPDVMTPCTWSLMQIYLSEASPVRVPGGFPLAGNIAGRPYVNLSLSASLGRLFGMDPREALERAEALFGRVPDGMEVPLIPFSLPDVLRTMIPGLHKVRRMIKAHQRLMPAFVAAAPAECDELAARARAAPTAEALAVLWHDKVEPTFRQASRILRAATRTFSNSASELRRDLLKAVGESDTNALLSNLGGTGHLASIRPLVGLAKVARGEMSRENYVKLYGHRGPSEMEISLPRPAEALSWLERQLASFAGSPTDVEDMLAQQRRAFDAAWTRYETRYPRKARRTHRRIDQVAAAAQAREAVRSEVTRVFAACRTFALRAGELTGLGESVFFLTIQEIIALLSGDDSATAYIAVRKETHARYSALPPYPAIIRGRFDAFQWAADPHRRSDIFDAQIPLPITATDTISGFAGAAGRVEGHVRRLDNPEEGPLLQPGEILVAATTNIGWTPLFLRAAAVVTDVGAPLSHAAIVARELGIPAVVGCGDATMRLQSGDRVRVDGGQGTVTILGRG